MNPLARWLRGLNMVFRQVRGAAETDYVATSLENQKQMLSAMEALVKATDRLQKRMDDIESRLSGGEGMAKPADHQQHE